MVMLAEHGVELEGKEAVVIGRSEIVGKPMAMLLLARARDGDDLSLAHRRPRGAHAARRHRSSRPSGGAGS